MGRRIAGIVVLLAVLLGGFLLWRRHNETQEMANGEVHCDGCMTPEEHARFLKENAGETADGASDRKNKTAREEAATDFQDAAPAGGGAASAGNSSGGAGKGEAKSPGQLAFAPAHDLTGDTLPPNAQNGAHFAGSGTYQWYRQGNLTWRIDTATGRSCIIYATLEEWRKQIVIRHGCGPNA